MGSRLTGQSRAVALTAFLMMVVTVTVTTLAMGGGRGQNELPASPPELRPLPGNLEGEWRFRTDPENVGERSGWHRPDFDDSSWRLLKAPGNWEAQGITDPRPGMPPKPKDRLAWTDYDGTAWYRKTVRIPESWRGKSLLLLLGSVDDFDRTFFNGSLVGETPVGTERGVQVQRLYKVAPELVRAGADNVIAVQVTDAGGPGGIMGPILSLLPEDVLSEKGRLPDENRPLEERFADPPASARILKIIHNWPDDPASQDLLVHTLIAQGFGGVVCNVFFDDQYLRSEQKWQSFVRAVKEAKAKGMTLWLYDERGYPSGVAGGLTMEGHPEWEAQGLLIAETITDGKPIELSVPPGRQVLCAAYPVRPDGSLVLDGAVALTPENGTVRWTPPSGSWHVMVVTEDRLYEGTHAAHSLADRLPYINLLIPEPTARFLELTHGAYARYLGEDLGKYFVSTFTDEPSLMSLFFRRMPYRVLPWSATFTREFQQRRGYDLMPRLPLLSAGDGPEAQKTRHDFWKTVAELVSENYFGQIQEWCARHNILSGGHLLLEENLSHHVPLYGDFFACVRRLSAPSIDCLTSLPPEVPWHIARMTGSVADLEGRTVTMCETSDFIQVYRPEGDTRPVRPVTEEEIRGTCNRLILGGVHTITSYYSFRDITTEQLQRLNNYVGRCATMLTGGHQVADIAVLYPIESAWTSFRPSRQMTAESPETLMLERCFRDVSETLSAARRDFTYVDSKALVDSRVENGELVHGQLRWRIVVLPGAHTLPLAAWRRLEEFAEKGGIVIAVGALPRNSETDFPSDEVLQLSRRLFGEGAPLSLTRIGENGLGLYLPEGTAVMLPQLLDKLLESEVRLSDRSAPIRATHRRIEGHEVYFLINDSAQPWEGTVSVSASGPGELWDPLTGRRTELPGPNDIPLSLPPYSGAFLRFASAQRAQRLAFHDQVFPRFKSRRLAPSEVSHGAGEFVQAALNPSDGKWQLRGVLRKSDVDTFLFAICRYETPLDLSTATALQLDIEVPANPSSAPQILFILTDRHGVHYFAETGRPLSVAGTARLLVPLSRFVHASFAPGPAGPIDWKSIVAINVGWGGHYGREGDVIEFTFGVPEAMEIEP